ncbi:MAG: cob(I)yrinic acid a,c-diamide adenosyltransferase [Phycisphaerales bacterium JB063]
MRIYTRRGDAGQTDLIGGARVGKCHPRVEAFGCVDELNAALGLALAGCGNDVVTTALITVQHRLFDLGAQLATPDPEKPAGPPDGAAGGTLGARLATEIRAMEAQMDRANAQLPALTAFILPGGCELAARLHLARTACRRAERRVVELAQHQRVDSQTIAYLNRLSDMLFVLARLANHDAGDDDVKWQPADGPAGA